MELASFFFFYIFDEATDREVMKRKVTSSQSIPEFIYLFIFFHVFPSQVARWMYVYLIFFENAAPSAPRGEIVLSRLQCGSTRQEAATAHSSVSRAAYFSTNC